MSNYKHRGWLRISGFCGVITPMIVLPLILLSISNSPWFSWTENALSDLGVHEAAFLFNSSLMIGGILTLMFALGLMQTLRQGIVGFTGTLLLILAAVSFFAVGFFPETAGRIHLYVSVSFFTLTILSLLIMGIAMIRDSRGRKVGLFSVSTGFFEIVVWTVFWALPHKGVAIPEMLASLTTSAWVIIMGVRMFMQASKS